MGRFASGLSGFGLVRAVSAKECRSQETGLGSDRYVGKKQGRSGQA